MNELEAARRLVKSAPELWETCSDPDSLARHLQAFGEIRITRLEPESTVAWEGESASGTVELEPSGWGTKVTLTARAVTGTTTEFTPSPAPAPGPVRRSGGLVGVLRALFGRAHDREPAPAPPAVPPAIDAWPEPPEAVPDTLAALESALDSLGAAHHRPFSRE